MIPHTPPKGFTYEIERFNSTFFSIWICNHNEFSYTHKTPKSIWGFYNSKTKLYHSPIDCKKVGSQVNLSDTTPYSAMILKLNPLEQCMYLN
jgi:hypothetical protein